jgi:hypothetical protein
VQNRGREAGITGLTGNSVASPAKAIALLREAGAPCHVFGGWAEELLELAPARPHGDIDLLYCVDAFD